MKLNKKENFKLTWFRYSLYGLPSSPIAAAQMIVYIAIPPLYSTKPEIGLVLVGLTLMFSRLLDMVTDPILGNYLDIWVSKTGWGVWFISSWPLLSFGMYILLNPSSDNPFLNLSIGLILVTIGWTIFSLSWWSMGIAISENSITRLKLISVREGFAIPGVIFGGLAPFIFQNSGAVFFLASLLLLAPMFLKEAPIPIKKNFKNKGFLFLIKSLLKENSNFKNLLKAYFFLGLSNGLTSVLFILFVSYIIGGKPYVYLFVYFISAFLGIPIVSYLGANYGKRKIWMLGMILSCIFFCPVVTLGYGDITYFIVICSFTGLCLSADLSMPTSIQADIIANAEENYRQNLAGRYYAIWSLVQKLALALSAGLGLSLLSIFGFDPNNQESNFSILSLAYGILPIIFKIPAIVYSSYIKEKF